MLILIGTAYFGGMLYHLLYGWMHWGFTIAALFMSAVFASIIAIHAARCKASTYAIIKEIEIRGFVAITAPVVACVYIIGYMECYRLEPPFDWLAVVIGLAALGIRWREVIDGYVHWFGYDNTKIPGTLRHLGGFQFMRQAFFIAMILSFGPGGKLPFTLPICTVAVVLLCTYPICTGQLSRYEATAVRLKKSLPGTLPLGWLADNSPVFWRVALNLGHITVFGATRAGKSSLVLAPLLGMLKWLQRTSAIIVDMKGDKHDLYGAAMATGLPVHVITNAIGEPTRVFNLFLQDFWKRISDSARGGLICMALNLDHGDEYGESFFREVIEYVSTYSQQEFDFNNWGDFARRLEQVMRDRNVPPDIRKNAAHLFETSR